LRDALAIWPQSAGTWAALAQVLAQRGMYPEALTACDEALKLDPKLPEGAGLRSDLERAVGQQRAKIAELRGQQQAQPGAPESARALSEQLYAAGQIDAAVERLRQALAGNPQEAALAEALAWILATAPDAKLRDGTGAVRWARVACAGERGSDPAALDTLAAAQAEAGDFDAAVATARRGVELAKEAGNQRRAARLLRRLALYEGHQPYHEPP
jgi:tetratricopeptide (TPR) repeat protein